MGLHLGLTLGSAQQVGPSGPSVTINGLTGGVAIIGDHASITMSVSEGTISARKWGSTPGGSQYGTGTSPTDYTAGNEGALYATATVDGSDYSRSAPITYAAPVAAGGLSDQSFTEDTGVQTYDVSGDFTGAGGTWSLPTTISGVTISGSGVVQVDTDALAVQADTTIVARYTNSGGFDDSGFGLTITEAIVAPVLVPPVDVSGAPSIIAVEYDKDCTVYGLVTAAGGNPNAATIKGGTGPLADSGAATASTPVDLDFDLSGETKGDYQLSIIANNGADSAITRQDIEYITVPGTMSAPTVTSTGETSISVDRAAAPADTGGRTITSYDLRWQPDGGSWTTVTGITDPDTVTGLTADTLHNVQTRAVNSVGAGAWSASGSATTDAPASATDLLDGIGDFSDPADWSIIGPGVTVTGGVLDVNTSATFKFAYRDGGDRLPVGPGVTLDLEFQFSSVTTPQRMRIKLRSYTAGGAAIDADTIIWDSNVEGAVGTSVTTKTSAYTTPATTANVYIYIEFTTSGFVGQMDYIKLLEQ